MPSLPQGDITTHPEKCIRHPAEWAYPHCGFHFSLASQAETRQTIDICSGIYGKDILQVVEAKETNIVKTHNPPTLKHSQKTCKETLTCRAPSHFGRSGGRNLALGHAPCVWFPEGRGPARPLARTQREASFAPPSPQERGGTVLALAPCVAGRLGATAARPRALCAPARSRSRPLAALG